MEQTIQAIVSTARFLEAADAAGDDVAVRDAMSALFEALRVHDYETTPEHDVDKEERNACQDDR